MEILDADNTGPMTIPSLPKCVNMHEKLDDFYHVCRMGMLSCRAVGFKELILEKHMIASSMVYTSYSLVIASSTTGKVLFLSDSCLPIIKTRRLNNIYDS